MCSVKSWEMRRISTIREDKGGPVRGVLGVGREEVRTVGKVIEV